MLSVRLYRDSLISSLQKSSKNFFVNKHSCFLKTGAAAPNSRTLKFCVLITMIHFSFQSNSTADDWNSVYRVNMLGMFSTSYLPLDFPLRLWWLVCAVLFTMRKAYSDFIWLDLSYRGCTYSLEITLSVVSVLTPKQKKSVQRSIWQTWGFVCWEMGLFHSLLHPGYGLQVDFPVWKSASLFIQNLTLYCIQEAAQWTLPSSWHHGLLAPWWVTSDINGKKLPLQIIHI